MSALVENLRAALVGVLIKGTWDEIDLDHKRVQLPRREDLGHGWGKPKYVERVLIELSDDELLAVSRRCVETFPDRCVAVQNALWWLEADGKSEISEVTRLALADALDGHKLHPQQSPDKFMRQFAEPTDSGTAFNYDSESALYAQQDSLAELFGGQPQPPQRTSHRSLLNAYGFLDWPDARVFHFLESLVHPRTRQGDSQQEWVELINQRLSVDGYHLVETETISGHPMFSVARAARGVQGRPKNLIFASTGPKPELGFSDAINNDIVVLRHEDHCLIYSERIGEEGLRWEDLVAWWEALHAEDPKARKTRKAFGNRLLASLGSPAEKRFFEAYFRTFKPKLGHNLPALVPQVYLHYDPVTLRQLHARGEGKRFEIQRMDFLMLLPERVRVILEIDGQQHYTTRTSGSPQPSPKIYAGTMKADRRLRLAGYEVYRFGGHEVRNDAAAGETVAQFFSELFRRHRLLP